MTRAEQLKLCSVCKHRKMDMQQGMLCELTNAKAYFDETCPNYDEDEKEKAKSDRIERENQETLTVSGWLAFFLWVGVGLGAVGSCIFAIASLKDAGLTFGTSFIYFFYIGSLVATAVLAIKAFYQKAPNAVALAKTYIAMIAIDGVVSVSNFVILNDDSMLVSALRSFVWAGIWFTYLSSSTHVANMIPKSTRLWKLPEKILLSIYALACAAIVIGLANFVNNPADSNFYQKDYVIDATIEAANEELPDYSDPLVTSLKMVKEGDNVVYSFKFNNITETLDEMTEWELALINKQEMLAELALEQDQDIINVMNIFFNGGYNVCYRYLNATGSILYDVIISGEEYNNALNMGPSFKCDEKAYQSLLDYYTSLLPMEYMGDATLVDILHKTNALAYYVQLPKLSALELTYIDTEYLTRYIQDEWEALDDDLKTLAKLNKEDIAYHFYTTEGDEHCIVSLSYDEYINLEE
jgi:hypothetical protein